MELSQFGLPSEYVEKITAAIEGGESAVDKWSQFCSSVTGWNLKPLAPSVLNKLLEAAEN